MLVEILLDEGDADAAWDAARAHGCDERWWMTLARAREATHPTDAVPIGECTVEAPIGEQNAKAYGEAAEFMARIE